MGEIVEHSCLANSARLDWLSVSFRPSNARQMEEILEYVFSLAKFVANETKFEPGGGRRFFSESITCPDAGVLVRWTPHGGKINGGCVSIDLQGDFWELLDTDERKAVILDLAELPGFNKCTRADFQRTIKDPVANSERIFDLVRNRQIWIAGYNKYQAGSHMDSMGCAVGGASTLWGTAQSQIRGTTYNKAVEQNQPELNVVRHEVRTRKESAHGYFCDLVQALRKESSDSPSLAESIITRSVVKKHMTYLDTSRFASIRDKKQWPKNWVQNSAPADFMAEVLDGETQDVKRAYRVQKRLEERKAAADKQYGPTQAQWVLMQMWQQGMAPTEVLQEMFDQWVLRLRDEHREDCRRMLGDLVPENFDEVFDEFLSTAAHNAERPSNPPRPVTRGF